MPGTVKKLRFSEGTNVGAPTDLSLQTSTSVIKAYANDAAYVLDQSAQEGSVYLNTTTDKFRMYVGGAWRNAVPESDASDPTKVFLVDVSGNSTGVSSTIRFVASGNRIYTFPNGTGNDDVVLRTLVQVLTNKELTAALLDQPVVKSNAGTATVQCNTPGDDVSLFTNADDITIGQSSSDVIIPGNLTVQGTTTNINSSNLAVTDQNITVNNGGNDVSAEGAGLTVDRAGTDGSLVYQDSLASKWKAGALGSEIQLANVSSTQVFTNKDYDGGTASNTSRMTLPKNTKSNLDALTRKEATIVYSTDLQKAYIDNGSTLTAIGSGTGSGETNYVTNSDAETDATNTAVYKDAAAATPVDGTGGSPTVTLTRSTSSPLRGNASFLLTKPASNVQGEGYSWTLNTVDLPDRNKKLKVQFDYDFTAANFAYGDVLVFIYDITNTTIITPQNNIVDKTSGTHIATWDATSSSSYRLILHHATTSALAYTLKVDNVIVGPGFVAKGAVVSNWQQYTPTYSSGSVVTTSNFFWRRVGDEIEVEGQLVFGNNSGAGAGVFTIGLPNNYTVSNPAYVQGAEINHGNVNYTQSGNRYWGYISSDDLTNSAYVSCFTSYNIADSSGSRLRQHQKTDFNSGDIMGVQFKVRTNELDGTGIVNLLVEDNLTNWRTYSLTIGGSTTAPTQGSGASNVARWRRVGDTMEIRFDYTQSNAGSNGSGTYLFPLPAGYTIDTTKLTPSAAGTSEATVGFCATRNGGTFYYGNVAAYNSTNLSLAVGDSAANLGLVGSVNNNLGTATQYYSFVAFVPITQFANAQNGLVGFAGATSSSMGLVKLPASEIWLNTGNGFGGSGYCRRFSNTLVNIGSDITYTDTNGAAFTINWPGIYSINWTDTNTAGSAEGITLNAAPTSGISAYNGVNQLTYHDRGNQWLTHSVTKALVAGDVIRFHTDAAGGYSSSARVMAKITQVYRF